MTDMDRFETRLATWLEERADLATRPFDAGSIARAVATQPRRRGWLTSMGSISAASPRQWRFVLVMALLVVLLAASAAVVGSQLLRSSPEPLIPADRGVFTLTARTASAHQGHTATLLADGRVLVIGGDGDDAGLAEAWDPGTGSFSPAGVLAQSRGAATSTLLPDGRILVVGGTRVDGSGQALTSAELWDPTTSSFSPTGSLALARSGHLALLLRDGRVLVIGGRPEDDVDTAEIWDPTTGSFADAPLPRQSGMVLAATLLSDGRVFLVGQTAAQVWDPATDAVVGTGKTIPGHVATRAMLLHDGRVLVIGNAVRPDPVSFDDSDYLALGDVWDPATGLFTPAGSTSRPQVGPVTAFLEDGRVLVVGGWDGWHPSSRGSGGTSPTGAAELWDPASNSFSPTGSMHTARGGDHTATTLLDGRVLVVGDTTGGEHPTYAELYEVH